MNSIFFALKNFHFLYYSIHKITNKIFFQILSQIIERLNDQALISDILEEFV